MTNILLTELSQSVWENFDLGHVYRPHCIHNLGQDSPSIQTSCLVNKSYVMIYVSDHLSILIVSTDADWLKTWQRGVHMEMQEKKLISLNIIR